MRETAQIRDRDGQRTPRASDRRLRCHVPPDVRSRAVDEPRRVRLREPPLAAPQRRDLQPRRRRGGRPQRPIARRRLRDSRLLPRSFRRCIRSARATRGSSCRAIRRTTPIYTTPGEYIYSPQHPASVYRMNVRYETVGSEQRRRDHARRDADAPRFGARRARRAAARPRSRLSHRLRPRTNRVHAPGHAVRGAAARRRALRGERRRSARRRRRSPGSCRSFRSRTARSTSRAINQSQSTSFNAAATSDFQGSSTLTTGVTGQFNWDAAGAHHASSAGCRSASRKRRRISHSAPRSRAAIRSSSRAIRERRTSRRSTPTAAPRSRSPTWRGDTAACRPTETRCASRFGGAFFDPSHAATLVWQTNVAESDRTPARRVAEQHRSAAHVRRQRDRAQRAGALAHAAAARPGRPLQRRVTQLQLDRQRPRRGGFTQVSEHSNGAQPGRSRSDARRVSRVLDAARHVGHRARDEPDADLRLRRRLGECRCAFRRRRSRFPDNDTTFTGKRLVGVRRSGAVTERDPFSHSFNADVNDTGLPGDVVDTLVVSRRHPERIARRTFASAALLPARSTSSAIRAPIARSATTGSTKTTSTSTTR